MYVDDLPNLGEGTHDTGLFNLCDWCWRSWHMDARCVGLVGRGSQGAVLQAAITCPTEGAWCSRATKQRIEISLLHCTSNKPNEVSYRARGSNRPYRGRKA